MRIYFDKVLHCCSLILIIQHKKQVLLENKIFKTSTVLMLSQGSMMISHQKSHHGVVVKEGKALSQHQAGSTFIKQQTTHTIQLQRSSEIAAAGTTFFLGFTFLDCQQTKAK